MFCLLSFNIKNIITILSELSQEFYSDSDQINEINLFEITIADKLFNYMKSLLNINKDYNSESV